MFGNFFFSTTYGDVFEDVDSPKIGFVKLMVMQHAGVVHNPTAVFAVIEAIEAAN
jgi:hypothetical protein